MELLKAGLGIRPGSKCWGYVTGTRGHTGCYIEAGLRSNLPVSCANSRCFGTTLVKLPGQHSLYELSHVCTALKQPRIKLCRLKSGPLPPRDYQLFKAPM